MSSDLLRATTPPKYLEEFDRLEARRLFLARRLPWTDDDFNEMLAINRQLVALAVGKPLEAAA